MTSEETPFIVMSAPNGARRGKSDHAGIPLSAAELAENAQAILDCGASLLHLHVRDESDRHSLDPERYRAAIDAVRDQVGEELVVQIMTEAVGVYSVEQQISIVKELKPEAVSIALREFVSDRDNTRDASCFFEWLRSNDVMPQYILYSVDEVRWFEDLRGLKMVSRCE